MYAERLGERWRRLNPFLDLQYAAVELAFGSDTPVTEPNPWEAVRAAVEQLPAASPLALHFDAVVGFRRGRSALVAAVSAALVERHQRVVDALTATGADLHIHYVPGHWIPHSSLATLARRDQLGEVAAVAYDVLPLKAIADRVALVDSSTGQRWPMDHLV